MPIKKIKLIFLDEAIKILNRKTYEENFSIFSNTTVFNKL